MMEENSDQFVSDPDEQTAQDAVPVCPRCMNPCNPLDYYCPHCGSNEAINPLSPYIPFVNIRFQIGIFGKLWNRCVYDKEAAGWKKIFYFLLLLFWAPVAIAGLPFVFMEKIEDDQRRIKCERTYLYGLIFVLVSIFFAFLYFTWLEFL